MNQRDELEAVFLRKRLTLLDQLDEIALLGAGAVVFLAVEWTCSIRCSLLHVIVHSIMIGLSYYPYSYPYSRVTTLTPQIPPACCRALALAGGFASRFQLGE